MEPRVCSDRRNIAPRQEVVAQGVLLLAKTQPEQSNPDQINGDDRVVKMVQAHASCTSLARFRSDLLWNLAGYLGSDQWRGAVNE